MRRSLSLLLATILLARATAASARETPRDELLRAIQLFENFQDPAAAEALHDLLHHSPPAAIAARAHIYLALIQLNQANADGAKEELEKAVSTDVMVDLPPGQSPKAQVLFAQARREMTTVGPAAQPTPPPAPAPAAAPAAAPAPVVPVPVVVTQVSEAPEPAPSHLPAYLVGVGSLVAFGVGGLFGYLQQQALSDAKSTAQSPTPTVAALQNNANTVYPQDGLIADILFGVGAAAGVTAIILFATEGSGHGHAASVSVSAGPQGLSLQGAF